ncbi:uncharacterized protein K441DRAFT_692288 [Cenococcum geophilum 1.58]|uniref:uncharacterized protein n=1 Tax=Cenococcum geophilum 1.58 TaxID=794803 RepID=UPI00358F9D8E|nr:hypothetical protein K441DRAFT_692288 [Cenococcum geophilum 1.58]
MNVPDPLSFCISTLALADLGCKYQCAHEEIGIYRDIIKSTSDLVAETKDKLQRAVAGHLPNDDMAWIYGKVQQAEVLLAKANKSMKGMDKVVPQKRFRWVFQKRAVAESYKGAIYQCHVTLSQIRSRLIGMQNREYGYESSWIESDRLPPSRQIANAPWEHPADDCHWSSPTPRRIAAAQGGHHGFPSPYPSSKVYKAATVARHTIPLVRSRRTNTDLHAWLLNSVLQNAR